MPVLRPLARMPHVLRTLSCRTLLAIGWLAAVLPALAQEVPGLDLSAAAEARERRGEPTELPPIDLSKPAGAARSEAAPPPRRRSAPPAAPFSEKDVALGDKVKAVQRKGFLKRGRFEVAPVFAVDRERRLLPEVRRRAAARLQHPGQLRGRAARRHLPQAGVLEPAQLGARADPHRQRARGEDRLRRPAPLVADLRPAHARRASGRPSTGRCRSSRSRSSTSTCSSSAGFGLVWTATSTSRATTRRGRPSSSATRSSASTSAAASASTRRSGWRSSSG